MVKRDDGYILVAALVVIALMMVAGALLAGSLHYRMWLLRQQAQDVHLTALADAGMAQALDELWRSHSWPGVPEQSLGEGTIESRVEMGGQVMQRVVVITATYGQGGRSVRAVILLSDFLPPRVLSWEVIPFQPEQRSISGF